MKERIPLWDNLKFILILLVVIGHYIDVYSGSSGWFQSIFLFIYAFHMPVLLFLSGMLYNGSNVKKKILFYLGCGFALKLTFSFLNMVLFKSGKFSLLSDGGIPWFMFTIAIYYFVIYKLGRIHLVYFIVLFSLIGCFLGFDTSVGDYLYISRSVIFFPFFLAGRYCSQIDITGLKKKYSKYIKPASVVVLILWGVCCFVFRERFYVLRHLFTGRNAFSSEVISYGPLARLICYAITVITGAAVIGLCPDKNIPFLTEWGRNTINVYFWHWPVLLFLRRFTPFDTLALQGAYGKMLIIYIAILIAVCLSCIKIFQYPVTTIRHYSFYDPQKNQEAECEKTR